MSISFGNKLKELRNKLEFSQAELAKCLGTTKGTISKWENGKLEPDIEMLKKTALVLNTSLDNLLNFKKEEYIEFENEGHIILANGKTKFKYKK